MRKSEMHSGHKSLSNNSMNKQQPCLLIFSFLNQKCKFRIGQHHSFSPFPAAPYICYRVEFRPKDCDTIYVPESPIEKIRHGIHDLHSRVIIFEGAFGSKMKGYNPFQFLSKKRERVANMPFQGDIRYLKALI